MLRNRSLTLEHQANLPTSQTGLPRASNQLLNLAFRRTAAVIVAPPKGMPGKFNNGSAFVVQLADRCYLGTARHVIQSWLARTSSGEDVIFQVRDAEPKPSESIVWKDEIGDLAFLSRPLIKE